MKNKQRRRRWRQLHRTTGGKHLKSQRRKIKNCLGNNTAGRQENKKEKTAVKELRWEMKGRINQRRRRRRKVSSKNMRQYGRWRRLIVVHLRSIIRYSPHLTSPQTLSIFSFFSHPHPPVHSFFISHFLPARTLSKPYRFGLILTCFCYIIPSLSGKNCSLPRGWWW